MHPRRRHNLLHPPAWQARVTGVWREPKWVTGAGDGQGWAESRWTSGRGVSEQDDARLPYPGGLARRPPEGAWAPAGPFPAKRSGRSRIGRQPSRGRSGGAPQSSGAASFLPGFGVLAPTEPAFVSICRIFPSRT